MTGGTGGENREPGTDRDYYSAMDRDASGPGRSAAFDLEEIAEQPGTYFNPRTEVTVVVDDSGSIDQSAFTEVEDGADWIRVSEEPAIDEQFRDELLERYEAGARDPQHAGIDPDSLDLDDEDFDDEDDEDGFGPGFDPEE